MKKAKNITAKQIVNEDPITASTTESLSQIKNRMEENGLRAIPVVNNGKFKGAISYRELIRYFQFNPKTTKVEKVLHNPATFQYTDNLIDLANLRINSGNKMFVALDGNKLKGIISEREILEITDQVEELQENSTRDIATYELLTAFEEDKVDKARHMMLDNNISRLPVINDEGNLTGVLHSTDLLKMMVPRERVSAGGTSQGRSSGNRKDSRDTGMGGANEREKISNINVEEIMDRTPTYQEGHSSLEEAIKKMKQEESDEVIITDEEFPESIVTIKDIIRRISQLEEKRSVAVQITGLELPEEKAAVNKKLKNQIQGSLGRKLKRPKELTLHIKKKEADGTKHRYEVTGKLYSELGITTANAEEWDLLDSVDRILDTLNKQVSKKKEKQRENR